MSKKPYSASNSNSNPSNRRGRAYKSTGNPVGRPVMGLYPDRSRTELAKRMNLTIATVTRILNGTRRPNFDIAARLARVLGVTLDRLSRELKEQRDGRTEK